MRGERPGHSLQATALVNEAYTRLVDYKRMQWQNRAHFFAVSAQLMRRILVEHARRHNLKRGGGIPHVSFEDTAEAWLDRAPIWWLSMMRWTRWRGSIRAKCRSSKCDSSADSASRKRRKCSKFLPVTVMRDWSTAKTWLYRELTGRCNRWTLNGGNRSTVSCSRCWSTLRMSAKIFLRQACAGDQALEREVRSLLKAERKLSGNFLESPAVEAAAMAIAKQNKDRQGKRTVFKRPHRFPLPYCGKARQRRNGRGLQGRGHGVGSLCRPEILPEGMVTTRRLWSASAVRPARPRL